MVIKYTAPSGLRRVGVAFIGNQYMFPSGASSKRLHRHQVDNDIINIATLDTIVTLNIIVALALIVTLIIIVALALIVTLIVTKDTKP
jgi:hypothetical protein